MERRWKIIAGIIVAIVIIAIVMAVLFLRPGRSEAPTSGGVAATTVPAGQLPSTSIGTSEVIQSPVTEAPAIVAVRQVATTFAERYGSFSTEGRYVNVSDLAPLMTDQFQRTTMAGIAAQRPTASGEFSAVTTVVISTAVEMPGGDSALRATVRATTQRTEVTTTGTRTYPQEIIIKLVKFGEEWRVDGADWQPTAGQ
ncbi:MAG: hypothetical protein V1723_01750 [Candidatus Uhrbacteria bacterium]